MSTNALFDEDSSDEEQPETKSDTPKQRKVTVNDDDDDDDNNDNMNTDNDNDEKEGGRSDGNVAEETATKKQTVTNSDLFGDESDDDDDDAMKVEKPSTTNAEEEKKSPKKSKPPNSELFGEDSDDEDEDEAKLDDVVGSAAPPSSKAPKAEETHFHDDDDGPGMSTTTEMIDATVVKPPEKATVLESTRPSDDVTLHMTKLPNLVAVQPSAFDEIFYDEKEEEEQYKGYVHNMIRWRYQRNSDGEIQRDENGNLLRESNSRLVQWSDGSFTLHIGNEAFDVHNQVSSTFKAGTGVNGFVYLSQKATFSNEGQDDTQGGTVLECIAPVTSRFVPKPSSLQSEAHKSLTVAVRQRTIKKARIAEHVTYEDPEKAKEARIRNKDDLEKATSRRSGSGYRASTGTSRYRRPAMNRGYLEEEEDGDYDTTKINALKKGNVMDDDMDDYGDESEDDGYQGTYRKGRDRKRRKQEREEEEEEEELVFGAESDEEEGTLIKASKKPKRSHQAVVDDDDDDED